MSDLENAFYDALESGEINAVELAKQLMQWIGSHQLESFNRTYEYFEWY